MGLKSLAIGGILVGGILIYTAWNQDLALNKLDLLIFGDNPQQQITVALDQEVLNRSILDTNIKQIQVDLVREQAVIESLKLERQRQAINRQIEADKILDRAELQRQLDEAAMNAWIWAIINQVALPFAGLILLALAVMIVFTILAGQWGILPRRRQEDPIEE